MIHLFSAEPVSILDAGRSQGRECNWELGCRTQEATVFWSMPPCSRECVPIGMGWIRSMVFYSQDIALAGTFSYTIHFLCVPQQPPLEMERFLFPSHKTVTPTRSPRESPNWGRERTQCGLAVWQCLPRTTASL